MSDSESTPSRGSISPGWVRIGSGAALLMLSGLLKLAGAESGGSEADGAEVLMFLVIVSGFFGALHFIVGCVMHALDLHEQRAQISSDRS